MAFGLRVITKINRTDSVTTPRVGEVLPPSRRWADNDVAHPHCWTDDCSGDGCDCDCADCTETADHLTGTSAITVTDTDDLSAAIAALRVYGPSATDPVVLLESARYEYGEDRNEIVLTDARVIRVWTWQEIVP